MILYHASTAYHVLCCIVHKLAYHKEEEAIFMIVEYMLPRDKLELFIDKIRGFSWFNDIIIVPESTFRLSRGKSLKNDSSESDILEVVENICSEVHQWYKEGFLKFDDIYVASDQWSVGVYLLYNKIPYHYFEDASGMLGDEERYLNIIRDMNYTNYIISQYLKGVGRSEVIIDKLCDMMNQPKNFFDTRAVDFSIYHILKKFDSERIEEILSLYGGRKIKIDTGNKITLLLTQFLRTLTIKNLEVQEKITTLLVDYFNRDNSLIIKPHPKDKWIDYSQIFHEVILLEGSLPSELLPFVFDGEIDLVLTASSTSIGGLRTIGKKAMSFGTDIEIHYERLHEMYVVSRIIKEIFNGQRIWMRHIIESYIENFLSLYPTDFTKTTKPDECIYIDGGAFFIEQHEERQKDSLRKEDIRIYLNHNEKYEFLMNPNFVENNFIIVTLKIKSEELVRRSKEKEIWIYCMTEEEREKILKMNEIRTLKYSGIDIEISSKEATYLMILNGKMKAMQYALKQKESDESNLVLQKLTSVIKQYQDEDATLRVLLEEEGIIHE